MSAFPYVPNPFTYAESFFPDSFGDGAWHWALRAGPTGSEDGRASVFVEARLRNDKNVTRGCDRRVRLRTGSSEVSVRVAGKALAHGDLEHGPVRLGEQRKCLRGAGARVKEGGGGPAGPTG